jgi:hypothetical protein
MARDSKDSELIGFVDVAGFAGVEDGEAIVKPLEVSVNREVAGLPTKYSQRVHGERIEVYKRTLGAKSNPQMSAVEKHFKEVQKPFEQVAGKMESPSKSFESPNYEPERGKLTPTEILKNMIDNLDRRVQGISNWSKVALILGTVGVCGFIIALATILR